MKSTSSRAFTLVEILVVVAIIGLLAGLFFTNTDRIFGQSQEVIAKVFVNDTFKTALVRSKIDVGDFPSTADGLAALLAAPSSAGDRWRGPYADVPGGKIPLDPWGQAYQYRFPGTHNKGSYDIFSNGVDHVEGTADDIGNW